MILSFTLCTEVCTFNYKADMISITLEIAKYTTWESEWIASTASFALPYFTWIARKYASGTRKIFTDVKLCSLNPHIFYTISHVLLISFLNFMCNFGTLLRVWRNIGQSWTTLVYEKLQFFINGCCLLLIWVSSMSILSSLMQHLFLKKSNLYMYFGKFTKLKQEDLKVPGNSIFFISMIHDFSH